MKKIISLLILFCLTAAPAIAVEFDSSIDSKIRQDYGVDENDLPALPSALPDDSGNFDEGPGTSHNTTQTKKNNC